MPLLSNLVEFSLGPALGRWKGPRLPVLSESPGTIRSAGSARPGQHNVEVYTGLLGRSAEDLAALHEEGVL